MKTNVADKKAGLLFRFSIAWKALTEKKFVFSHCGDRTYIKGMTMNDLITHHNELSIFINKIMANVNAQESALREAEQILKQSK